MTHGVLVTRLGSVYAIDLHDPPSVIRKVPGEELVDTSWVRLLPVFRPYGYQLGDSFKKARND